MTDLAKPNLQSVILTLLNKKNTIHSTEVLKAAGLIKVSKNQRAVQRALTKLIKDNILEAEGKARARVYRLKNTRKMICYNQEFLNAYLPNQTSYLTQTIQQTLFE